MTDIDPSQLSVPPTRQHPGWILISAIRQFRGLIIPAVILLWSRGRQGDGGGLLVFALLTAATLLWQIIAWWNLTYEVTDGRLIVRSGVVSRRERFVPLERVQAVDLVDTPLQRLFGLATVRIETAAAGTKEADVRLEAVPRLEAEALRSGLLAAGSSGDVPDAPAPPLFALTAMDVLKAGATSGRIGPALAALIFVMQVGNEVLPESVWSEAMERVPAVGAQGAVLVVVAGAALAWLIAIFGAALTWSGFEMRREGDRVLIAHGLLDRRRTSVPVERIQAVAIREGMLRRPFGLAEVTFTSAGWGKEGKDAGTLAPVIPAAAAPALIRAALPEFALPAPMPSLAGPPPRAFTGYLLAALTPVALLAVVAVMVAAWLPQTGWRWGLLALAAAPIAGVQAWFARRDSGAGLARDRVLVRQGGLTRTMTVTLPGRVQWRGVARNPFQRRSRLADLTLGVAGTRRGGPLGVHLMDEADAGRIVAGLADATGPRLPDGYTSHEMDAPAAARDSRRIPSDERRDAGAGAGGALRGDGTGSASPAAGTEDDPGGRDRPGEGRPDGGTALPDGALQG
jgi:putative membrane protein